MTKGFTLIELLVVIAIIGILSSFAFISFGGTLLQSKEAKAKAEIAKKLKAQGVAPEIIAQASGLTVEQIKGL